MFAFSDKSLPWMNVGGDSNLNMLGEGDLGDSVNVILVNPESLECLKFGLLGIIQICKLITSFCNSTNDICNSGGGRAANTKPEEMSFPLLWMINQAALAGLKVNPPKVEFTKNMLQERPPLPLVPWFYHLSEIFPFSHWSYDGTARKVL